MTIYKRAFHVSAKTMSIMMTIFVNNVPFLGTLAVCSKLSIAGKLKIKNSNPMINGNLARATNGDSGIKNCLTRRCSSALNCVSSTGRLNNESPILETLSFLNYCFKMNGDNEYHSYEFSQRESTIPSIYFDAGDLAPDPAPYILTSGRVAKGTSGVRETVRCRGIRPNLPAHALEYAPRRPPYVAPVSGLVEYYQPLDNNDLNLNRNYPPMGQFLVERYTPGVPAASSVPKPVPRASAQATPGGPPKRLLSRSH